MSEYTLKNPPYKYDHIDIEEIDYALTMDDLDHDTVKIIIEKYIVGENPTFVDKVKPSQLKDLLQNFPFPWKAVPTVSDPVQNNVALDDVTPTSTPNPVNPATATIVHSGFNYDTPFANLVKLVATQYKDYKVEELQSWFGKMASLLHNYPKTAKFGVPFKSTMADVQAWMDAQSIDVQVVGPYNFWSILEKLGVACSTYDKTKLIPIEELNEGESQMCLKFESSNIDLYMLDRFTVHIDPLGSTIATTERVNEFLETLRSKKVNYAYVPISHAAYTLAFSYMIMHCLTSDGKRKFKISAITEDISNPFKQPRYPKEISELHERITANINDHTIAATSEFIVEAIALWVQDNVSNHQELADTITSRAANQLRLTNNAYLTKLRALLDVSPADRLAEMTKLFKVTARVKGAIDKLGQARALRNKGLAQKVNHNVASPYAGHLIEWVDTAAKGANLVKLMSTAPTWRMRKKHNPPMVYGVAYGHMSPYLSEHLRMEGGIPVSFYDIIKAKDSPESFKVGNVLEHSVPSAIILDDSLVKTAPEVYHRGTTKNPDLLKVIKFMESKSLVFVSKVTLKSFETVEMIRQWHSYASTYKYNLLFRKAGRLHNEELYVMGYPGVPNLDNMIGAINAISLAVEISNELIMKWHTAGVRATFCNPSVQPLMKLLIKTLPGAWSHYVPCPTIKKELIEETIEYGNFDDGITDPTAVVNICHDLDAALNYIDHGEGVSVDRNTKWTIHVIQSMADDMAAGKIDKVYRNQFGWSLEPPANDDEDIPPPIFKL